MLRRFISYYRPYKKLFILTFTAAIFVALLEIAFPLIVNRVVDTVLPQGNLQLIFWACLALLFVYIFNSWAHYIVTYWGHRLGINIETDMRAELFDHIQKLSFTYHDNHKTGHLLSNLTNELFEIGEVAHHGPEDVFIALMTFIGSFGAMLYINTKLALLMFIMVPAIVFIVVFCNQRMTKAMKLLFRRMADFNARVEDTVGGIRLVQAFANEKHESKLFHKDNYHFRDAKLESYRVMGWNMSLSYLLMRIMMLTVLLAGSYFILQGNLSIGDFMAFILLTNIFFRPIEKINAIIESYPKGYAGFKRFLRLIDTEPDIADQPEAITLEQVKGEIVYKNVRFGYAGSQMILDGIDLSIRAGETVAFVGPSGAGKTTLCSLLPRFYEVQTGSITVDGKDIREVTLGSLRKHIGIVQQDVFLFSGTLRENIRYGKLDAKEEEIIEAAQRAELASFIESLPEGLDTVVGERGVKLSGGQKQRLSIARMFLKNPPILILDEATSALDTETELSIQRALNELSEGRTTLVIAHRLATIRHVDRIIVTTPEGIEEQGTHQELIKQGGHYATLHEAQYAL
ncbi:ABC transporter ATP-binding protein [Oceanobacillus jeddahense]|uniref:ABC transporter ATP-binding protein/permease n=1 Tax=Oceanobacillus jeddahense TaxID=1462527 RepID=A0ABY5JZ15_9BACI|nr:ABC transporter ATP-binding protein [Oceanobacillus jeddahense]UUI05571.1 ABC transporter ATP-binding protein/permease [Oceanobacillus jeddahense]